MSRKSSQVSSRTRNAGAVMISKTIERVADARLPTDFGDFRIIGYRSLTSNDEFVVLVHGKLRKDTPTVVRIHSQCLTGDVFGSTKCDCGKHLRRAMELIKREGSGAIVYRQQSGRATGIINKIRAYALQDEGGNRSEMNQPPELGIELDGYAQYAEILGELGVNRLRLISNMTEEIQALEKLGLSVDERISLLKPSIDVARRFRHPQAERLSPYLQTPNPCEIGC